MSEVKVITNNPLDNKPIEVPPFCNRHHYELVHQARYRESDPWQALTVIALAAMFQGATATPTVWRKIGDDVHRMHEIGCLACRLPARFRELVKVAKSHDLGKVKALGESWVDRRERELKDGD